VKKTPFGAVDATSSRLERAEAVSVAPAR
jgi:hypothetical protein